jgi:hypothetical protein
MTRADRTVSAAAPTIDDDVIIPTWLGALDGWRHEVRRVESGDPRGRRALAQDFPRDRF